MASMATIEKHRKEVSLMANGSTKAYQVIADRIIESLDKGEVPWRKPWSLSAGIRPQNVQGRPYSGINRIVLGLAPYSDPRWITFSKAIELGGHIKKGEKSTPIVFWKFLDVERENQNGEVVEKTIPLLRYYSVFNIQQCEGLKLPSLEIPEKVMEPILAAEKIVANMPNRPAMEHDGGDRAYYSPTSDSIHLPLTRNFHSMEEYYSTAFHELGHSTGHPSRLNRHEMETGIAGFGSPVYSREELVAEFTSAFLCNESGIQNTIENSTAYIRGWSNAINRDKRMVVTAASLGQKAADNIIGGLGDGLDAS